MHKWFVRTIRHLSTIANKNSQSRLIRPFLQTSKLKLHSSNFILRTSFTSNFISHSSSFKLHCLFFILQTSSFILLTSFFILYSSNFIVHCSNFIVHCSNFILYCSNFILHCSLFKLHSSFFKVHYSNFNFHSSNFKLIYRSQQLCGYELSDHGERLGRHQSVVQQMSQESFLS